MPISLWWEGEEALIPPAQSTWNVGDQLPGEEEEEEGELQMLACWLQVVVGWTGDQVQCLKTPDSYESDNSDVTIFVP